jgi:hypothetical protein
VDERQFWRIVGASRWASMGSVERQAAVLEVILGRLPAEAVRDFHTQFVAANHRLYTWDLWGAAYVLFGGCGDDTFTDLRSWLVSRGSRVCRQVLAEPDLMARLGPRDVEETSDAELLSYVAADVYERRTGRYLQQDAEGDLVLEDPDGAPRGEPFDERDLAALAARYPRLARRRAP